jgi:hypothetical protein
LILFARARPVVLSGLHLSYRFVDSRARANNINFAELLLRNLEPEKEFGEIDIVCPGAGVYEPVRQMQSRQNYRTN